MSINVVKNGQQLSLDASGNLYVNLAAAGATVSVNASIYDASGNPVNSDTFYNVPLPGQNQVYLHVNTPYSIGPGTAIPIQIAVVGGQSNDATPQYRPIPEGPSGRSVIVEGVSGGQTVAVSGTISVAGMGGSYPIAVAVDSLGKLVLSDTGGGADILYSMLQELRAIKIAIIALDSSANPVDFEVASYSDVGGFQTAVP
jgi:hypothetical protein